MKRAKSNASFLMTFSRELPDRVVSWFGLSRSSAAGVEYVCGVASIAFAFKGPVMAPKEPVKGTYQHFKGAFYEVLGIAEAPETGKRLVVYQALGLTEVLLEPDPQKNFCPEARVISTPTKGELGVCSLDRFGELVDGKEYHPGKRVPRFRLVSPAPGV
jgi:hypothetical protein